MYTPNQMNSLYFYPHKLHFSPIPDASDSELRNRWFPSYKASTARQRSTSLVTEAAHDDDSPFFDKSHDAGNNARLDDDGAPCTNSAQGDG